MKTLNFFAFAISAVFLISSCSPKPEGEAETSAAEEVEEVSASSSEYSLNLEESEVSWYGFKPTGSHYGTIGIQDGQLAVENNEIVGGSFTMDMNNIVVKDEDLPEEQKGKLTGHLKSPDFFNVEAYPTSKFVITNVEAYQNSTMASGNEDDNMALVVNNEEVSEFATENPTHNITGNLTMRDTTLSITFPAHIEMQEGQVMAKAKFNIDRSKWNVNYLEEATLATRAKDKLIYDTVNVGFDIVASEETQPQAQTESAAEGNDS